MSNDIITGTGAKIVKDDGFQPCKEHGGVHQIRTITASKGSTKVQVTQTKGGQTEVHTSKPGDGFTKYDHHHGNDKSAAEWLRQKLSGE